MNSKKDVSISSLRSRLRNLYSTYAKGAFEAAASPEAGAAVQLCFTFG